MQRFLFQSISRSERSCWQFQVVGRIVCLCALLLTGCAQETPDSGEILDESWFNVGEEGQEPQATSPVANVSDSQTNSPAKQRQHSTHLGVHLQTGMKFPLQKVVQKTLTQTAQTGQAAGQPPLQNSERIELFMAVTVEEIQEQNKKFNVRYTRVQYESHLNGEQLKYDSSQPPPQIPESVLVYHGMVNNGFSFWVGADNKITEVLDFDEFLERCLAQIPSQNVESVSQVLANYSAQDGIANFIDDTIGLLPYDPESSSGATVVQVGGHWSKSRHYNEPVPMTIKNTYTLQDLNDDVAKIEIMGEITPISAAAENNENKLSILIKNGHSMGHCTIDRKTGLPLNSHVDHQLSMVVQMNGLQFHQEKRVVTTIRMFPEQKSQTRSPLTADRPATTASHPAEQSLLSLQPVSRPRNIPQ